MRGNDVTKLGSLIAIIAIYTFAYVMGYRSGMKYAEELQRDKELAMAECVEWTPKIMSNDDPILQLCSKRKGDR